MNEPRRLRDLSTSEFERSLLNAGTAYGGSPELRAKTLAALGVAGSTALATGTASAASATASSLFSKLSWTKLALSASLVGAGVAGPIAYYEWQQAPAAAPMVQVAPPLSELALPPAPSPEVAPAEALPLTTREAVDADGAASATRPPARSDTRGASASAALTAELGAIDGARRALARGDAGGALSQLDAYSRSYPRGRLALEAEVLRIDALAQAGRRSAAKQRAAQFLKRYPNSVLASRVRGYLSN